MANTDDSTIREQLRSLAEQYARGVDRHDDVEGFVALFLPDAVIEIFDPSDADEPRVVPSERISRIPESIQRYAKTFHVLGQSTYDIGDGEATGEVYCIAHHLTPDQHGGTNYVMYIRYQDVYRPDDDGVWRFARRALRVDWTETRAANPPTK
jgi:ketosteroid isomerase-like protein